MKIAEDTSEFSHGLAGEAHVKDSSSYAASYAEYLPSVMGMFAIACIMV